MTMDPLSVWNGLREALLLIEAAQYRGVSGVRFDDLVKLVVVAFGLVDHHEKGPADEQARRMLKATGGALDCNHEFSRKIWADWVSGPNAALAKAATDSARKSSQYPGQSRGGTVMKRSYGGRVVYQPGRRDQSHASLPSAMDTYDVLMRADGDVLTRFAYAPTQGEFEERAARLEDLMAGRSALPLRRRPQPERPTACTDPECSLPAGHRGGHKKNPAAQPVPRIGQNPKKPRDGE